MQPIAVPLPEGYDRNTAKRGDLAFSLSKEFIDSVRALGFPYYQYDDKYINTFNKLKDLDVSTIVVDKVIRKNSKYSKLASVFFPHLFDVKIPGKKTPKESWSNDRQLALALELASDRGLIPVSMPKLRSALTFVNGSQCVSNFRPEVAKYVYSTYGNQGSVYDYSMGWGGRLTGFLASNCKEYVGVDVNAENLTGYDQIKSHYSVEGKSVWSYLCPAEDFINTMYEKHFDLAFSSPPYFAKEKYSDDEDQSFKKYTKLDAWVEGFLTPVICNCRFMLKDDGVFGINIADININGKTHPLISITKRVATENGFAQFDEICYDLPRTPGQGTKRSPEPIMFFRKVK